MKGDLSTLKKICLYASKAMLAGMAVLLILIVFTVAAAAGAAAFPESFAGVLESWTGHEAGTAAGFAAAAWIAGMMLLGFFTVYSVYRLMRSVYTEHSPFNPGNVGLMISLSKAYLISAPALGVLEFASGADPRWIVFVFFGLLLVGVTVYCLGLAFRYGCLLQKESDETL